MTTLANNSIFLRIQAITANRKTIRIAFTAAIGAFIGSAIGVQVGGDGSLIKVSVWDACIGLGIGIAIALVQNRYMRAASIMNAQLIRTGWRCALGGAAGGAGLILMKTMLGEGELSHIGAWTVEGLIMGWLLAPVFPNLPRKPALLGGMLAGFLGSLVGQLSVPLFGSTLGVALADSLKGLFLGAMLTISEKYHAISHSSLIVHWGKNETSTILLGKDPISIGSDPKCQVYLKKDDPSLPSIIAVITEENGKVVLNNRKDRTRVDLPNRTIVNVGVIKIEVTTGVRVQSQEKRN